VRIIAVLIASATGVAMLCAAVADGGPGPEPIPLSAAAIATPVRFPTTPPIRATPLFVSTAETPVFFSDWQRKALMRHYIPEPEPDPDWMGR
jgi:hypothetical protein